VDKDVLRISVEKKTEKHEELESQKEQRKGHTMRVHRYERCAGRFWGGVGA